jgi:AcrR family transcriptional regulator
MSQNGKKQVISNQERNEIADKLMLESAIELILEKGTEKTTLKEVGERAGYSRGLAGYRFGSKSGLFKYVLQLLASYWQQDIAEVSDGKVGLEALLAVTQKHYELFEKKYERSKTFYILWFQVAGVDNEFKKVIARINKRRQQDIVNWILSDPSLAHKHQDAELIGNYYNLATNGMIYNWLLNPSDLSALKSAHDDLMKVITLLLS